MTTEHLRTDRRYVAGRNLPLLRDLFAELNNTNGRAMTTYIENATMAKGQENVAGTLELLVGPVRKGEKLSQRQGRRIHKSVGRAAISGQDLAFAYPIALRIRKGEEINAVPYVVSTVLHDLPYKIGSDQYESLHLCLRLLHDRDLEEHLPAVRCQMLAQRRARTEREPVQEYDLAAFLRDIPSEVAQQLEARNINLSAIRELNILRAGSAIAEGKLSSLLWALDKAKASNVHNWMDRTAVAGELPGDVYAAWVMLRKHRKLATPTDQILVEAYEMQVRRDAWAGIAGSLADELTWIAKNAEAKQLYESLHSKKLNLSLDHVPAKIYKGPFPEPQKLTIEQMLAQEHGTIADREGILRVYPVKTFREHYNRDIIQRVFADADFGKLMNDLAAVKELDAQALAVSDGKKAPRLGTDYYFVRDMFEYMRPGQHLIEGIEHLLRRTPEISIVKPGMQHTPKELTRDDLAKNLPVCRKVNNKQRTSAEDTDKLYVIAQQVQLRNATNDDSVLYRGYVSAASCPQQFKGVTLRAQDIADCITAGLWILEDKALKNKIRKAGLTQKNFSDLVKNFRESYGAELQYGLVRKELVYAPKAKQCTLAKLAQVVYDAKPV